MSIFKNEYILSQSVKKSINSIANGARIDLTLSHNPIFDLLNTRETGNNTLENRMPDDKVIVIIKNNYEAALANADVVLYRGGRNKSFIPVDYSRTNSEGICLFVNDLSYFKKK